MRSKFEKNYFLLLLLLFILNEANSGVADLSVKVRTNQFSNLNLGDSGTIELLVTNNGPDVAGIDAPITRPIALETEILTFGAGNPIAFFRNVSVEQDCFFTTSVVEPRPPNKPGFFYSVNFSPIEVNETVSCLVDFLVLLDFDSENIEWDIFNASDLDEIDLNNQTNITFLGSPVQVPSLSYVGVLVYILLVFAVTMNFYNRHYKNRI